MHTSTCRAYAYLTNQYIYLAPFGKPLRLVVHILIFVDPGVKSTAPTIAMFCWHNIRNLASEGCFIFQRDSAPDNRARETVEMLKRNTPDFIPPTVWPPNSPDLNPVDYKVWSVMQEQVYQTAIHDVDDLKQRFVGCVGGSGSENNYR